MDSNFLAGKTILVADDEQFSRQIVVRHLRDYGGPTLLLAKTGAEALLHLSNPLSPCDVAIVDFIMPGVNGLTVLKSVRTGFNGIRRDLPVLLLTGNSDAELVSSALLLDVDALVVKPVSKAVLAARLAKVMAEHHQIRPVAEYQQIPTEESERKAVAAQQNTGAKGQAITVEAVATGAVLARDLRNASGTVVLPAGVRLTERYILRLRELAAVDNALAELWIA